MLRIPALTAFLVLVAGGLCGCALLDDVGDSDLDDALELVPGDATSVVFRQVGVTISFAPDLEDNVVWEVTTRPADGGLRAYKFDDDLDLDEVGDGLVEAGFDEDEVSGQRHFSREDVAQELVLVPDEHLMIVGDTTDDLEASLDVLDDDTDSLTDSGTFDDLLDHADDPGLAMLVKDPHCTHDLTPDRLEAIGRDDLGTPEAMGFFSRSDGSETSTVLVFEDDDAAEADLEARETYLDEGVLERIGQPLADIATWDLERDGAVVRISYEYDDPDLALRAARHYDGFHACGSG